MSKINKSQKKEFDINAKKRYMVKTKTQGIKRKDVFAAICHQLFCAGGYPLSESFNISSITTLLKQLIVIAIFKLLEATSVAKRILAGCLQCILLSLKMYLKAMPK